MLPLPKPTDLTVTNGIAVITVVRRRLRTRALPLRLMPIGLPFATTVDHHQLPTRALPLPRMPTGQPIATTVALPRLPTRDLPLRLMPTGPPIVMTAALRLLPTRVSPLQPQLTKQSHTIVMNAEKNVIAFTIVVTTETTTAAPCRRTLVSRMPLPWTKTTLTEKRGSAE